MAAVEPSTATTTGFDVKHGAVERVDEKLSPSSSESQVSQEDADAIDMQRMGKKQELRRMFGWFSSVGFTSCCMGTWEFVFVNEFQGLVDGGRAGLFWNYVWIAIGNIFIVLSLAEMASMAPTAGGQYHWVSEFAPRKWQKPFSYVSGWLSSLAWQATVASNALFIAQLVFICVSISYPDLVVHNWHVTLTSLLAISAITAINVFIPKTLPKLENTFVIMHVLVFFIVLITVAVTGEKQTSRDVFLQFSDNGGNFPSLGLAVMVGTVTNIWNTLGFDSIAHLSEEVNSAGVTTPSAMLWSYIFNIPSGIAMLLVFLYTVGDLTLATTSAPFPFAYVLQKSSLSQSGQLAIAALLCIMMFMIGTTTYIGTSRQAFAFARDDGFPGSSWLKKVDPWSNVPRNACLFTSGFSVVMSFVYLGSTTAFNAIISLSLIALESTWFLSIACVLYRRVKWPETLPPVKWRLGKWGVPVNMLALVHTFNCCFWSFWPIYWNPTAAQMNWSVVMFGGVMGFSAVVYWVRQRHIYKGPVALCEGREFE